MAEPTTGDLLFLLAKNGSEDIQELLNSSNYNAIDHLKNTLLHYAAAAKHENVVKLLLALDEEKKILNHQNNLGDTPLHKAAYKNSLEIVRLLVNKGAQLDIANSQKNYPIHLIDENKVDTTTFEQLTDLLTPPSTEDYDDEEDPDPFKDDEIASSDEDD